MSIEESQITQEQALNVILQGVVRGQRSGVYTLAEAELISKAIRLFTNQKREEDATASAPESDSNNIQI